MINFSLTISKLKKENESLKAENQRLIEMSKTVVNGYAESKVIADNTIAEYRKIIQELDETKKQYQEQLHEVIKLKKELMDCLKEKDG